jgi:hypothetical protein
LITVSAEIRSPPGFGYAGEHGDQTRFIGNIEPARFRLPAGSVDLGCHLLSGRLIEIGDDNTGTGLSQGMRGKPANTVAGAGDHGDPVVEPEQISDMGQIAR